MEKFAAKHSRTAFPQGTARRELRGSSCGRPLRFPPSICAEFNLAGLAVRGRAAMKMLAEYLEHAIKFEQMAAQERDAQLRADFEKQAAAYRKLAENGPKNLR